jgi:hypothetical protein
MISAEEAENYFDLYSKQLTGCNGPLEVIVELRAMREYWRGYLDALRAVNRPMSATQRTQLVPRD